MTNLTYAEVSRLLKPDFETGQLFWLPRTPDMLGPGWPSEHGCATWNSRLAGKEAFTADDGPPKNYKQGAIFGKKMRAHRVIWLLHSGQWPSGEIDHINGDGSDNRICNLREVTHKQNCRNMQRPSTNSSGAIGVSFLPSINRWRARIYVDDKDIHLGHFKEEVAAIEARLAAEQKYGFDANHGRA